MDNPSYKFGLPLENELNLSCNIQGIPFVFNSFLFKIMLFLIFLSLILFPYLIPCLLNLFPQYIQNNYLYIFLIIFLLSLFEVVSKFITLKVQKFLLNNAPLDHIRLYDENKNENNVLETDKGYIFRDNLSEKYDLLQFTPTATSINFFEE